MGIDILETTGLEGLTEKQLYELARLQLICDRLTAANKDITEHFSSTWTRLALSLGTLGEPARKFFHQLSRINSAYKELPTDAKFSWAIKNTKLKGLSAFDKICKQNDIDTSGPNSVDLNPILFLPPEVSPEEADCAKDYGFFAMKNRYYKLMKTDKGYRHEDFTNFVLKIKYHIYDKLAPKRIIELTNIFNKKITVDAPTDIFASINNFKKFIEGLGNFLFDGTAVDLMRLKRKLFSEEKECYLVDILGWNKRGFWAWGNGIYNKDRFIPCDDDGIVELPECMYYIPAGNKLYSSAEDELTNQKNFRHIASEATLSEWSRRMQDVFGANGMVGVCFGISCLFSDVVFSSMHGFPMMFLYGEGSSGKGMLMSSTQALCGIPQTPLKISEKANTDKAKIREMAQFRNGICGMEEYTNSIDDKALNTLKGIWDRLGYKRAILESKYGNESVPVNSGVFVTGNEYPADDPLLQRLVVLEMNKNKFTEDEKTKFNELKEYQEKGITSITNDLMRIRDEFVRDYRSTFQSEYKEMSKELALFNITDRMVNNVTMLLATYQILKRHYTLPFSYNDLSIFLKEICEKQSMKREIGAPVQQWWDTILMLINQKKIHNHREVDVYGDFIVINYSLTYSLYAEHMFLQRIIPQKKGSLMDKLKLSKGFVEELSTHRYGKNRTSGYKFKLSEISVDLVGVIDMIFEEDRLKQDRYRNGFAKSLEAVSNPDLHIESTR